MTTGVSRIRSLFWSGDAMAWYARHHPVTASRIATFALALWVGIVTAAGGLSLEVYRTIQDAVASAAITFGFAFLPHFYTWLPPLTVASRQRRETVAVVLMPCLGLSVLHLPVLLFAGATFAYEEHYWMQGGLSAGWPEPWEIPRPLAVFWILSSTIAAAVVGIYGFAQLYLVRQQWGKLCLNCGYDLRGLPKSQTPTCPECGEPIPDE